MNHGFRLTRATLTAGISYNMSLSSVNVGKEPPLPKEPSENFQLRGDVELPDQIPRTIRHRRVGNAIVIGTFNRENTLTVVIPNQFISVTMARCGDACNLFNYLLGETCMKKNIIPFIINPEITNKQILINHRRVQGQIVEKSAARPIISPKPGSFTISNSPNQPLS
jgi:hypothetical protein